MTNWYEKGEQDAQAGKGKENDPCSNGLETLLDVILPGPSLQEASDEYNKGYDENKK